MREALTANAKRLDNRKDRPVATGESASTGNKPDFLVFSSDLGTLATLGVLFGERAAVHPASSQVTAISLLAAIAPALTIIDLANGALAGLSVLQIVSARHARSPTIVIAPEELWLSGFATSGYHGLRVVLSLPLKLEDLLKAIGATGVLTSLALTPSVLAAVDFIRSEYARSFRSRELVREAGISFSHLAHLFRGELGLSSREYLTKIRVHVARHLLKESAFKLGHIAELTGFSDASHLSRAFSSEFGQRPGQYRLTQLPSAVAPMRQKDSSTAA
ncbi:helix-turn-helix transcriptional regulator [uncultured Bradyrhizobium sp.]|uniref:helix-turn-helix transcriptional regulator n=1 Tax=uncultured Bradyrhizobium sp. TaxID=199684 RepID=UPI0035CA8703